MGRRKQQTGRTPAVTELVRRGIPFQTHEYTHVPGVDSYGSEAAAALGVAARRVFKTLLASVDGELVVAILPVSAQLDLKALARAVGGRKATMAVPGDAERATGYVVGGISPIGQRRRHRTVLDASADDHATVFVSGGRRGFDIELDPHDLTAVTGAVTAPVTRST